MPDQLKIGIWIIALLLAPHAQAATLGLPIACEIGSDCFIQQYPDMDPATGSTADPWCGGATYDGHKGTDIRIRSMADVAKDIPVIAMADGTILRLRNNIPDHIVQTPEDRETVGDQECGNGLIIDFGEGMEAQYCHLKQGSIRLSPGTKVKKGDTLGAVGASGLAQFPHVHVTLRRNGTLIDPSTSRELTQGCKTQDTATSSMWDKDIAQYFSAQTTAILDAGFAASTSAFDSLAIDGAPPPPDATSQLLLAWVWAINLQKDDIIHLSLSGPDGAILVEQALDPLDRNKATYSAYIGKRGTPQSGEYKMRVDLKRQNTIVASTTRILTID